MLNIDKGSVKFGTSFVESVKQTLGQTYEAVKEAVPVVGQVEEFYAGSEERERARLLERGFTPEQIQAANVEKQQYTKTGEATSQFIQDVSDVTNIAPELVQAGAFVAESVLDARMAGRMTLDTARGAARMMPAEPAQALTITDPRFLKGITPGIADLPENRAAIDQLEKNLENIANRRAALTEKYADDPSRLQRKLTKLKKEEDGVISTLENMPGEKVAYGRKPAISVDPTEPTRLNVKGEVVPNPAHQHHMAGKAQTGAFVKAMREVGDDDDLIAMHSHIRRVLNSMGNVDANMLDIPGKAHIAMKGATEAQRARNVHSLFDLIDVEPSSKAVQQYIGDVKNADELMDRFNTYISEYMKPQKDLAIKITKKYLADHRESLSPKDLQAYDDLVSKLSGL